MHNPTRLRSPASWAWGTTRPALGAEPSPPPRPDPTAGTSEITPTRGPWIPRSAGRFLPGRVMATRVGDACDPRSNPPAQPQAVAPSCSPVARGAWRWWMTAPRLKFHRPSHSGGQFNQLYPECRNGSWFDGAHLAALRIQSSALSDAVA